MGKYVSLKNLKYLLHDVHGVEDLLKYERFEDYDAESIDILIDAIKQWSDKELYPYFKELDENPVHYKDGEVWVHEQVGVTMKEGGEQGFIAPYLDYDDGGTQMPHMVNLAFNHITYCANNSLPGYIGLTSGATALIAEFGDEKLKSFYIPKMLSGKWGGTMCLTEPQAGSSLSDITTSATPRRDGSYAIDGQKIFISAGDHKYCENFVHLVLARIEGAPLGTKGISLFAVPKFRSAQNGDLESNDVFTAGDFQKLGQKGYCTTHLVFGEKSNCHGWLVGQENMGLRYMFQMMNGARIDVGIAAASTATAAYYASLQYAKERPQGRKLSADGTKDVGKEQTVIINHPDVRRMLLLQKAINEGAMSLLVACTKLQDLAHVAEGQIKDDSQDLLELLTPIAKTYPSEMGRLAINNGLQIFGGYGFCTDFPLEQYYRDIRIMSLYEGTTGIQSLDLLGRKMTYKNGRAVQLLVKEMNKTIGEASEKEEFKKYADRLTKKLGETQEIFAHLVPHAMKGDYEKFLADATIFMEFAGTVVIAWQWLKMAVVAHENISTGNTKFDVEFYESKIHTMKFFFKYELSRTSGLKEVLMNEEDLTILKEKELIS